MKDRTRNKRKHALVRRPLAFLAYSHGENEDEDRCEVVFAHTEGQARDLATPHLCERYADGELVPPAKSLVVRRAPEADRLADRCRVSASPEVQRLAGLKWEGLRTCCSCGLSEPDVRDPGEWAVCGSCYQCGECGHDEECQSRCCAVAGCEHEGSDPTCCTDRGYPHGCGPFVDFAPVDHPARRGVS